VSYPSSAGVFISEKEKIKKKKRIGGGEVSFIFILWRDDFLSLRRREPS